jgi:hypothetical protein
MTFLSVYGVCRATIQMFVNILPQPWRVGVLGLSATSLFSAVGMHISSFELHLLAAQAVADVKVCWNNRNQERTA